MIRLPKRIIKKTELFNWFNNDDINKIVLSKRHNKTLKDETVCKIYPFVNVNQGSLFTMFGMCENVSSEDLPEEEYKFVKNVIGYKPAGFVPAGVVMKLHNISKEYKVNLAVSKSFLKIIEKYETI